jgi:hypothetical protein
VPKEEDLMILSISQSANFTENEQRLVAKVRKALAGVDRTFETTSGSRAWKLRAGAIIWHGHGPTRLDFFATDDETVGIAFLGPDLLLTDELFDGELLRPEVLLQFEAACAHFDLHLESTTTE